MLEIIALVYLTRHIAGIAELKGEPTRKWKWYTILGWFAGEITGGIFGAIFFGPDNFVSIFLVAIGGAIGGYMIVKSKLANLPDNLDNSINEIGNN